MKTKKLFIIGNRPENIHENWLIFNAPRPLLGDKEWQGDFQHGIFYVAIDPDGYIPESWIKSNCSLDGWLIEYISEAEAIQKAKIYLLMKYPSQAAQINKFRAKDLIQTFQQTFNCADEIEINL